MAGNVGELLGYRRIIIGGLCILLELLRASWVLANINGVKGIKIMK